MRINKKVLVGIVAFLVFALALWLFSIILSPANKYVEEPVEMNNLGQTKQTVNLSDINIESEDVQLYSVKRMVHFTIVENFLKRIGVSLEKEELVKDTYIKWSDDENLITYDAYTDKVIFTLEKGVPAQVGEDLFTSFYLNYFDFDYKVEIIDQENLGKGTVKYYGRRILDGLPIEFSFNNKYSAILTVDQEGNVVYGELLLAEIEEQELYIPTIKESDLRTYANLIQYPKEYYLNTAVLMDTLGLYDYLDPAWGEIDRSVSGCVSDDLELILLYKNTEQGYLLPVYRVDAVCEVEYEKENYSVPGTFYLNAVDPEYVTNTE